MCNFLFACFLGVEMGIKCIAFDCFGTVFDMSGVSRDEIKTYVDHVRREDFSSFEFPPSWLNLKAHPDSAEGIRRLQKGGFYCVTLSNGGFGLLNHISREAGIEWYKVINLTHHKAYKPHNLDAYRAVQKDTGFLPSETLMVTANPTFGDIEGAAAIGMQSQVIRQPGMPQTIIELAERLGGDWKEHDGGQCPSEVIEAGRIGKCVILKFRDNGTEPTYSPRLWRWVHARKLDDIIGYRIIEAST